DDTGVDREGLASHDPFFHAAPHHGLEQLAKEIARAKTTVAVLGERRMIGGVAVEPQATEPAVRQIEVDLVAQPPFGANAEAVADNEHPDHQLRIDRRATRLAVVRLQMRSNLRKVDEPVDPEKQVIVGDMPLKAKALEQRLLHPPPLAHHRPNLPRPSRRNQRTASRSSGVFQRNPSTPAGRSRRFSMQKPSSREAGRWFCNLAVAVRNHSTYPRVCPAHKVVRRGVVRRGVPSLAAALALVQTNQRKSGEWWLGMTKPSPGHYSLGR